MSTFPAHANAVVIGAGIVGNSMAYQLARMGWKDIVLLDKGPLPNPGAPPDTRRTSSSRSTIRR
jgi:glycine/D-amino acid oxidase-like deaminating enzyme